MKETDDSHHDSALYVNKGVEQPSVVNTNSVKNFKRKKRKVFTSKELFDGIVNSNISLLSQAITLIESNLPKHRNQAQEIIEMCLPHSGNAVRIGITGVPGVGKSTFIESFGKQLTGIGRKIAVLAIDPSSERSGGSILGDKTRMESLSTDPNAFIRPSPSAGSLGGVARKTRESMILCEAAGFDTIIVETVGVGQSETAVHSMVDFFLLLMLAGAGDELQGIKRGIMEMADTIAITKADGDNIQKAENARVEYLNALHLFPPSESSWVPKVLTCSAVNKTGIDNIWHTIENYFDEIPAFINQKRNEQAKYWMYETINEKLKTSFYQHPEIKSVLTDTEKQILNGKITSFAAAAQLIDIYFKE